MYLHQNHEVKSAQTIVVRLFYRVNTHAKFRVGGRGLVVAITWECTVTHVTFERAST